MNEDEKLDAYRKILRERLRLRDVIIPGWGDIQGGIEKIPDTDPFRK